MLQKLRMSRIDMGMRIAAPGNRYSTPRRYSPDTRSSTRVPTAPDGANWRNQQQERLMNGDKRRVTFGTPSVATINVDEDEDENMQSDQFLSKTDQFINQTEAYDTPNVNSIDSDKKQCSVCEMKDDHHSWECPLVDRVNIGTQLSRRIEQVRVQFKDKIREAYVKSRNRPPVESTSGPPPPRKASIPPPRTSAVSTNQNKAYKTSNLPDADETEVIYKDYYSDTREDEANFQSLEDMIQDSVKGTHDEASTPFPIVTTASTNIEDKNLDEDSNLIPIHADYEDDLVQGHYDAYGGGSTLNF